MINKIKIILLLAIVLLLLILNIKVQKLANDHALRVTEIHHIYDVTAYGAVYLPDDIINKGDENG